MLYEKKLKMRLSNETKNPTPKHTLAGKYISLLQLALCVEQRWNPQNNIVADNHEELSR